MAQRAFLLGGTGQTGRAFARKLAERGWEVTVGSRGEREIPPELERAAKHVRLDRTDTDALRAALEPGVDVLYDAIAFEPEHAEQLLALAGLTRSLIVLSSGAVYADARGRSFDGVKTEEDFPDYPVPIPERQPTVEPGRGSYATKKAAIEQILLRQDRLPATVVRAGAIYGPGSQTPREWHFVKRVLDRRRYVVLAGQGTSRFHPLAVENLAELLWLAAERPGTRVLNAGDSDAPTVLEIARAVAAAMEHEWTEVLLPGPYTFGGPGDTPWSGPRSFVMDMTEAEFELGYRPVTRYERAVGAICDWLVEVTNERDWQEVLPELVEYMSASFDYDGEDELLRSLIER